MKKKPCATCKIPKRLDEFHVNNAMPDGRHYYCKECQKERARAYRTANIEVCRARVRLASKQHRRRWTYGITNDEYDLMLKKQKGMCPICVKPMKRPSIDHCHATGVFRGILCRHCNSSLSVFEHDTEAVFRLIDYLGLTTRSRKNTVKG